MTSTPAPETDGTSVPSRRTGAAEATQGVRWGALVGVWEQALSVLVTVVLARLLTPDDFGIVAAAGLVAALAALLTQFGVGASLVRRPDVDSAVASTASWFMVLLSSALAVPVALFAAPLTSVVGVPGAADLVQVMMLALVLRSAASVPRALLQRRRRFRGMYGCDAAAFGVYATSQVGLALAGFGAMSVAIGQLLSAVVLVSTTSMLARHVPGFTFSVAVVREERAFGSWLLLTLVLSWVAKNVDQVVVSRLGGAEALGLYYVACVLPSILRQRVTWVSTQVLLPVFAEVQDDDARSRRLYGSALALHAVVGLPAMAGLAIVAEPLLQVFFGGAWTGGATAMSLLAVAAGIEFLTQAGTTVLVARGLGRASSAAQGVRLLAMLLAGALLLQDDLSLRAVALTVLIGTAAAAVFVHLTVCRTIGAAPSTALAPVLATAVPTALMAGALHVLPLDSATAPVRLTVLVLLGAAVFVVLARGLAWRWLQQPVGELRAMVPGRGPRR